MNSTALIRKRAVSYAVGMVCRLTLMLGVVALLSGYSCGDDPVSVGVIPKTFNVILRNAAPDGAPVNIFASYEAAAPGNALAPGATRTVAVSNEEELCIGTCRELFTALIDFGPIAERSRSTHCQWEPETPPSNALVSWTGDALVCSGWGGGVQSTTWKLVGVTGISTGTWGDIAGTANGTLTLSVPAEVTEGEAYQVSASFAGTASSLPGWENRSTNIVVGITDRSEPRSDLNVNDSKVIDPVGVSSNSSVSVSGAWVIARGSTQLVIDAGGGWTMAGTAPSLRATYAKVAQNAR